MGVAAAVATRLRTSAAVSPAAITRRYDAVAAAGVQVVVDVGLVGARHQRPAEAPQHEAAGEGGVRRHGRPQGEAAGVQRGAQDEQPAARHGVGPGARRHLEDARGSPTR